MLKLMRLRLVSTTALVALASLPAYANPLNADVVAGEVAFEGADTSALTVNQSTDKAIIDWKTFDIGAGEITTFVMPNSSSVVLNRVTGGLGPSEIIGSLIANGQVYLVNRDGILFGEDAVIDTGALVATTFDILDQDFLDGNYRLDIPGNPSASVVNLGVITVDDGGFAALVAPGVRNDGVITARLGKIALGSGDGFTLDLYGDSLIKLALGDEVSGEIIDLATGETLKSLISNGGLLSADGGTVLLTAASTRAVVDSVINNTGNIEANSVGLKNGKIVLSADTAGTKAADAPPQKVKVSGTISATGDEAGETGGTIEITGEQIELLVATIDAFGWNGGGAVLIGGDVGGGNPNRSVVAETEAALADHAVANATLVTVDRGTVIDASAIVDGDGGKVIVWSDGSTSFEGEVAARGGAQGGDGGFVETSGHQTLAFNGSVDTSAASGTNGTLLLDPLNVTIGTNGVHTITPTAIAAALATNNVKVTTGTPGAEAGDITVAEAVNWSSANSLTLSAYRDLFVNAGISNTGGANVNLRADDTGTGIGTVSFGGTGHVTTAGDVGIFYNPADGASQSTVNATRYTSGALTYAGDVSGGGTLTPYMLVNTLYDLQNIQNNLSGDYALGRDIDASPTSGWNSGAGFLPIGAYDASTGSFRTKSFNGAFDGQGHSISDLTEDIESTDESFAGLFGLVGAGADIRNVNLVREKISAKIPLGYVGGLAGAIGLYSFPPSVSIGLQPSWYFSPPAQVTNVSVDATIRVVTNSSAFGCCFDRWEAIGGLVGGAWNTNFVSDTTSANITFDQEQSDVGGFVGLPQVYSTISDSSSSGSLTALSTDLPQGSGNGNIGGFVGRNDATIVKSSSSTTVSGANADAAGGFAGMNNGIISQSYATGSASVTTSAWGVGGFVGFNGNYIAQSYSAGLATGLSLIASLGTVYSPPTGPAGIGGFVGWNDLGTVTGSYWLNQNSGPTTGVGYGNGANAGSSADNGYHFFQPGYTPVGGVGDLTEVDNSDLSSALLPGFDPAIWGIDPLYNDGYPYLLWERSTVPQVTVLPPDGVMPPTQGVVSINDPTAMHQVAELSRPDFGMAGTTNLAISRVALTKLTKMAEASALVGSLDSRQINAAKEFGTYAIFANNVYGPAQWQYPLPEGWKPRKPKSDDFDPKTGFFAETYERLDANNNVVEVVIAYRGSEFGRDWITGNLPSLDPTTLASVLTGNLLVLATSQAVAVVAGELGVPTNIQEVQAIAYAERIASDYKGIKISTTGHSLGAALAKYGAAALGNGAQAVGFDGSPLGRETNFYTSIYTESEILSYPRRTRASDVIFPDLPSSSGPISAHTDLYGLTTLINTAASMDFNIDIDTSRATSVFLETQMAGTTSAM